MSSRFPPRRQAVVHLLLLAAALFFLPIDPGPQFKPPDPTNPTGRILLLLGLTVLAPYFLLSATSPLLQRWFSLRHPGRSPYVLYALSNAGSLLALPAYVVLLEPTLPLRTQAILWSAGFVLFALACAACATMVWREGRLSREEPVPQPEAPPGAAVRLLWLLLPMGGSALLLAVTNALCQDMAVIPFLWVLPLGLYLLSFILCFESDRWYRRSVFIPLAALGLAGVLAILYELVRLGFVAQMSIYATALFAFCMLCHGELARLRPAPRRLTEFYLMISAGGALGAVFVALVAPKIFNDYFELHAALWGCTALALAAIGRERRSHGAVPLRRDWPRLAGALFLAVLGALLIAQAVKAGRRDVVAVRNFYGVLRVKQVSLIEADRMVFILKHGSTLHGWQFVAEAEQRLPTSYYGFKSGVGLALQYGPRPDGHIRVGVIGLGIGTVAAYGRPGDLFRFYEINPPVAEIAANGFMYLRNCPARTEIVLGDGRLSLEREESGQFDLLVLDAFSGDAIPVHLLTREAFGLYLRHLRPGGVIAVNISNNYLDLEPVVRGAAAGAGMGMRVIATMRDGRRVTHDARWALLSADEAFLKRPEIASAARPEPAQPRLVPWTDDHNDLFSILRWRRR